MGIVYSNFTGKFENVYKLHCNVTFYKLNLNLIAFKCLLLCDIEGLLKIVFNILLLYVYMLIKDSEYICLFLLQVTILVEVLNFNIVSSLN